MLVLVGSGTSKTEALSDKILNLLRSNLPTDFLVDIFLSKDYKRVKEVQEMDLRKKVIESITTLSQVMMPYHASHYGNVHGGTIMKLVDEVAYVAASRHARRNVVTASISIIRQNHSLTRRLWAERTYILSIPARY